MSVEDFRTPPPFAPIVETLAREITSGRNLDVELENWLLEECPSSCQDACCVEVDTREVLSEQEAEERFDDFLNEIYPMVTLGDYSYDPARVLKEMDPIAWRQDFLGWMEMESEVYSFPWNES